LGIAISVVLAALWVAGQCLGPFQSWDGVLYHVQGVAWAKAHPAIPGIANLHGPLAFNNSSFLYDALVDSWIWEGRGFHVAHGTLLLVSVLQGVSAGLRWRRPGQSGNRSRLLEFLLLPIALCYTPEVATYSTDLPMALTLSAGFAHACAVMAERSESAQPISRETQVVSALLFGAAIAIKLTAAVFAATALAVLVWRDRRVSGSAVSSLWAWRWCAVTLLIFLGPWVVRGIVLSGYPFFPLPFFGLAVDWRAPLEQARAELANITFTEREFTWHLIGSGWMSLTLVRNVGAILLPSLLTALAFIQWLRVKNGSRNLGVQHWALALPALAGIAAWFPSAPSHRYAPVLFWTLAAVGVSGWLLSALRASAMKEKTAWLIAVGIAISPLAASSASALFLHGPGAGMVSFRKNSVGSLGRGLPFLPTDFPTQPFVTNSGFVLNTPVPRANAPDLPNACGNAPLPCTANPAANLELRTPGNLEKGFRIRGEWQMVNFPYPWRPTFLPEWRARRKPAP
jgi:hypothetical protein